MKDGGDNEINNCRFIIGKGRNRLVDRCNSPCYGNYCNHHLKKLSHNQMKYNASNPAKQLNKCKFISFHGKKCNHCTYGTYCWYHRDKQFNTRRNSLEASSLLVVEHNVVLIC